MCDAIALTVAWRLAAYVSLPSSSFWASSIVLFLVLGIESCVLISGGFYETGEPWKHYLGLVRALSIAQILLWLVAYFYEPAELISRSHFVLFWVLSVLLVLIGRYSINVILTVLRQKGLIRYTVMLIADASERDQAIKLIEHEQRYNIAEVLDSQALDAEHRSSTLMKIQQLGATEVFVSWNAIQNRLFLRWQFQSAGLSLNVIPSGLETLFQDSKFWIMQDFPALTFAPPVLTSKDFWIKRTFDICVAGMLLVILLPLYLLIALCIKLDSPGAIFYRQIRLGLHQEPFKVWKFRTMVEDADQLQPQLEARNEVKDGILFKLKYDPRITKVGQFLRQSSLDELPQLINVLRGEMSLVGPRPLALRDAAKLSAYHAPRYEVLPGITGLWQVSGRSDVSDFEEVMRLDVTYIQNWTLGLDLAILFRTIKVVLSRTGAY